MRRMRPALLCLLSCVVFSPVARAQGVPVFEFNKAESTIKFNVEASVKIEGTGTGAGALTGTIAFARNEYGMNSSIPFIKIANRVEVTVDLKGKRVSGPPVALK
jgi:hypothetical protein